MEVTDEQLRESILRELEENRSTGAGGFPLKLSDVNLADRLGCEFEQLNRVLGGLLEDGLVHGKPRGLRVGDVKMEWDFVRLAEDPIPDPDPHEHD